MLPVCFPPHSQVILMLCLLYHIIGPSALIGSVCFVIAMVSQGIITKYIGKFQAKVMVRRSCVTDKLVCA